MKELVFLLEGESEKALIRSLAARLLPVEYPVRYIVFEGKQDLERQAEFKLRHYRNPEAHFILLRDKDSGDCHAAKRSLKEKCYKAGKDEATVRIACHEIESWYLADLEAIEKAYRIPLAKNQQKAKFRNPDALPNPVQELLRLVPDYRKIEGSRRIGEYLDVDNRRSRSFYHFIEAIKKEVAVP